MVSVLALAGFVWLVFFMYVFRAPLLRSIKSLIEKGSKIDE